MADTSEGSFPRRPSRAPRSRLWEFSRRADLDRPCMGDARGCARAAHGKTVVTVGARTGW